MKVNLIGLSGIKNLKKSMKNQELLDASQDGNLNSVKQILVSKKFDINCTNTEDILLSFIKLSIKNLTKLL